MKRYIFHHSQHPTNRSKIFQVYVIGMRFLFNKTKLPQLLFTCDLSTPPPPPFFYKINGGQQNCYYLGSNNYEPVMQNSTCSHSLVRMPLMYVVHVEISASDIYCTIFLHSH